MNSGEDRACLVMVSTLRRLRVFGLCKLRVVQKVGVASFRATKESGEKDT